MKRVCIVQARVTSTRLPGKVMLSLGGEPVIRHVLRRCLTIPHIDQVVCAVPDDPASRPIEREARKCDVTIVRGPEDDVLARYHKAASLVHADIVMRITADCPLVDPRICEETLLLMKDGIQYASNVLPRGFAQGLDCEVFTMAALARADVNAADHYDREHVTPWMQRYEPRANLYGRGNPTVRLCLDTLEDYLMLSEMFP